MDGACKIGGRLHVCRSAFCGVAFKYDALL